MNDISSLKRTLGTCYYPEHWPQNIWKDDAKRMAEAGLTWVRIGEFAWSMLEAEEGKFTFEWLDEAIDVLSSAGLKVVLGTPTATPPRWMIDKHPDMLAVDESGNPRKFGSRRHYCFSHAGYLVECKRIVQELAERYGNNPAIHAWQTDNEYGCHDTTLSYSPAALEAFRDWLKERYGSIDQLNDAWGNSFWSMAYDDFDQIDLPNLTVTEANPSHQLAFRRFSSDQVVRFNRAQAEIIRTHSKAPITHNFMGRVTEFDHHEVGRDLDFASWDSYPLGFLEDRINASHEHKMKYLRQGDPDFQAFHHDLYRTVGNSRWWVIEQQPGPVNWARYNPSPLPGMIRLWTWEAFAHGAEAVCYFRWRQAPFAQEQMHTGLLRPDGKPAAAMEDVRQIVRELEGAGNVDPGKADVALIFDYDAEAGWKIQPHASHLNYFDLVFEHYRALRSLGLSVDIISPQISDLSSYKLVLGPALLTLPDRLKEALSTFSGIAIFGPRTGAKTTEFNTPIPLSPSVPGLETVEVAYAESLPEGYKVPLGNSGTMGGYVEQLGGTYETVMRTDAGDAAVVRIENRIYVAGCLDGDALGNLLQMVCDEAQIETIVLPDGLRVRDTGTERFWFNYSGQDMEFNGMKISAAGFVREAID